MRIATFNRLKQSFRNWRELQGMSNMQSSNVTAHQGTHGDHSNTPTQNEPLSFVSAISELKLTDFIQCSVHQNMTPVILNPKQEYTQQEAQQVADAWLLLLSQYYEARKDKRADNARKMDGKVKSLKLRKSVIEMLSDAMTEAYNEAFAVRLKYYYPMLDFSIESHVRDLQMVKNMEVPNNIELLNSEKLTKERDEGVKEKPTEQSIYAYVAAYNRAFKTDHSVRKLYTLEYAYMCCDYDSYCDEMKSKNVK